MTIPMMQAANAYANRMKMPGEEGDAEAAGGGNFAEVLGNVLGDLTNTLQKADQLSYKSAIGDKVEMTDLVTAMANAEMALNTMVSVRDRVISAYQDIIRMPI